jgi:hypothetical protein
MKQSIGLLSAAVGAIVLTSGPAEARPPPNPPKHCAKGHKCQPPKAFSNPGMPHPGVGPATRL